jgi:uncharacterized surface protein with fasciclin (FAS1) repeats
MSFSYIRASKDFFMKKLFIRITVAFLLSSTASWALAADIVEAAAEAGVFKNFVAALKTSGFIETLKNSGPYTVFAPSDEAFAKLPADTWKQLAKDKTKLTQVLAYHVIPGNVMVAEVKPGNVKTVEGSMIHLTSDNGQVTVNSAKITQSDVVADNGVIHAIDTVIFPAGLNDDMQLQDNLAE